MRSQDSMNKQIALYGEPLGVRFARLLRSYRISQSRLAAVIGISAPMLSQLASGQRVKISNPAVYGRLLRLEQLADSPEVVDGDPVALRKALDDVASSTPRLTLDSRGFGTPPAGPRALRAESGPEAMISGGDPGKDCNGLEAIARRLASVADLQQLEAAAGAVPDTALALVLSAAADISRERAAS